MEQIRVLIVDDDPEWRERHKFSLKQWGYAPYIADYFGEQLLADAVAKAQQHACHVALVDMDLFDEGGRNAAGLALVRKLHPTESIIVTNYAEYRRASRAVQTLDEGGFGAAGFVAKGDGPNAIKAEIERVLRYRFRSEQRQTVDWPAGFDEEGSVRTLFESEVLPADGEIACALRRLFQNDGRLIIEPLDHADLSQLSNAPRIRSVVLRVREEIDNAHANRLPRAVKIAPASRIRQERGRYERYVQNSIEDAFHARLINSDCLWNVGVAVYTLQTDTLSERTTQPFAVFYGEGTTQQITALIDRFFTVAWDPHLHTMIENHVPLHRACEWSWGKGKLDRILQRFNDRGPTRTFREQGLQLQLTNPVAWVERHIGDIRDDPVQVRTPLYIVHNDLHADNLLVSADGGSIRAIDFERTGLGAGIQDFVQLEVDIVTRLARLQGIPYLQLIVALLDRIADPVWRHWDEALLGGQPEIEKGLAAAARLRQIAVERNLFDDEKTYLWGLLLSALYRASILTVMAKSSDDSAARANETDKRHTLLFAAMVVLRLEGGNRRDWWQAALQPVLET